jgi:hypothetical protein
MPRPPKSPSFPFAAPQLLSWAELIGEALGRGVARGINSGLAGVVGTAPRRGRPPKSLSGAISEKLCSVAGCGREARSKGLCSAHYQAERRRALQKSGKS